MIVLPYFKVATPDPEIHVIPIHGASGGSALLELSELVLARGYRLLTRGLLS